MAHKCQTATHLAVIYDDHLAVQILLYSRSVDVNRPEFAGNSALLLAAKTYGGFEPRRDAILEMLVSHPQSMGGGQRDAKGRSLLQYASFTSDGRTPNLQDTFRFSSHTTSAGAFAKELLLLWYIEE